MEQEKITSIAQRTKLLEGMSYRDWIKFKMAVEGLYERQQRELEQQLQPPTCDDVFEFIQREFG